ncbi:hypothetical protein [Taibaiella soli]|uniref:DUF1499 domain-containing protein n=1 Tax=Taibaiella soli TaxID=1649169 RepID=A0A2W2AE07_9BACT|nr:hypothetical protein [Taibaiella soli]PZF73695.1 hypothetical protein DN068_06780 [Taibaiella soli]
MKKGKASNLIFFIVYMAAIMFISAKSQQTFYIIGAVMGCLLFFSVFVRGNFYFKPYFTSRYNIFTSKVKHQKEFDLPKDILVDKMAEVLSEAGFKVRHADKVSGDLFATSKATMSSWGENIYIKLHEENGTTKVDFCSVCIFGIISWGKNERNYEHMMETFENSLII